MVVGLFHPSRLFSRELPKNYPPHTDPAGIAIPLALLMGSYGGLLLANQALRPVDRMTRAAEHIAAGDLSERVPEPARMDELGRLAATFNDMISRLQAAFERQKQFTSDASHELRTPLAVMRGDIEITLRRERSTEGVQTRARPTSKKSSGCRAWSKIC